MLIPAALILASCTWYKPGFHVSARCANGHSYYANLRRYGAICACREGKFGERRAVTYHGRRVVVFVVDRPDGRTDMDMDCNSFSRLARLSVGRLRGVEIESVRRGRHGR